MNKINLSILILALSFFVFSVSCQEYLFHKVLDQIEAKQYEQAAETFKQVIKLTPRDEVAIFNLGICYYNLKQYEQAADLFEQSIALNPKYTRAYVMLGISYDYLKRSDEAIIQF